MAKEWRRLNEKGSTDWSTTRACGKFCADARVAGKKVDIGLAFGIVGEKHSELKDGDPFKVSKGSFVFQGNVDRDENRGYAISQNLGSSLASMDASKAVDAWGVMPGHCSLKSDAEQA